ncbi:MAG: pre-peptidase C-terminal domain-containing protein, partial [Candidatus Poribacteria bacterium]|nr:pre-peptidase C-terminal domain-containing protein [Candidatus Poribacteria bacterium]
AEVILHEYGHAILDRQIPNIYTVEGAAMHEGFSDFLAASFFSAVSDGFNDPIVFDWAGSNAPEIFTRSVDTNKRYPEDILGFPHDDGQIWSAALWEIFGAIGRDASIRLVIESHFFLPSDVEFVDGASAIFMADQELNGGANFDLILGIMENRGFFTPPELASDIFEENDTPETAAAIELPFVNEELSIHTADNDDYFRFHLGETMQVGLGIDFQPIYGELMLTLTGPDGVALVTFETKDVTSLELAPGDYLAAVSSINGATNDYKLAFIIDNHGDTPDTATLAAIGDKIESFIDFSGDTDFFAFEGEKGQRVDITVATKSSDLDSLLVVYTPDGDLFAKSDDAFLGPIPGQGGIDSQVYEELPTDGTYLLAVSNIAPPKLNAPFGGVNYSYTLSLVIHIDDHAECGSGEETPLILNEPVTGVINQLSVPYNPDGIGDSDGFRFEAAAGDVIALLVEVESHSAFTVLSLLDEFGEELVSMGTPIDSSDLRVDGFLIPADGVYCVEVGSPSFDDYTYTLTLSEGELPDDDHEGLRGNPTPITANVPIEGVISFAGDIDAFQFTAAAGSIIRFNVETNSDDPSFSALLILYDGDLHYLETFDPNIMSIANDGTNQPRDGFMVPANGTYYVEVNNLLGSGSEDFTYTLTLTIEDATTTEEFPPYDVNQDGKVDIFDLVLVAQHFGEAFVNAAPPAGFGQIRSATPEGELRLEMTPSVTDTRQLTVSIHTTAITDLYGYQFSIHYDPTVLELLTASPSQVLAAALPQSYWDVFQQGTQLELTQTRQGTQEGVVAEGPLVTLDFHVKKTVPMSSQFPIRLVNLQLADSRARAIPVNVAGERMSMTELFPEKPVLLQNYPNPFNPETWIPYHIARDGDVRFTIYDTNGILVRSLDLGHQMAGHYVDSSGAAYWDGRNQDGEPVASGLYFYTLSTEDFKATRRMLIQK